MIVNIDDNQIKKIKKNDLQSRHHELKLNDDENVENI